MRILDQRKRVVEINLDRPGIEVEGQASVALQLEIKQLDAQACPQGECACVVGVDADLCQFERDRGLCVL